MEITLEKIELVKDRTGVSYKEAKEALEAANGSVVDAIINIEEEIDDKGKSKFTGYAGTIVDSLKTIIAKGNVSKILVKKDGEVILNLPLNVGIIGTVIAPLAAVAGVIAAFGTKCSIEVVKVDGTIIDVGEMAYEAKDDLMVKGTELAGEMKVKGAELYEVMKEKGADAYVAMKERAQDAMNKRESGCSCCDCDDICDCGEDCECDGACDCEGTCDCEGSCDCDCDEKCDCEECTEKCDCAEDTCANCEADDCENCK